MIFESHVGLLTKMVSVDKDERSTEIARRGLAAVTRVDEKAVPKDSYVHAIDSVVSIIDDCACSAHSLIRCSKSTKCKSCLCEVFSPLDSPAW